jgi:phosphoesterase RecJ-like protein
MARYNCLEEDVDGLVNYPLTISGVDVAVFFRELEDGKYRISLRSKNSIDVSQIATQFGGGGHRNASGCTLDGPLESARDRLLPKVAAELACGIDK